MEFRQKPDGIPIPVFGLIMTRALVLYAHPRSDRSEANAPLAEAARRAAGVTFVDLYAEYPTFEIDVEREQRRLLDHDVIVFQHPVYWYSSPALLKEWQDLVLEYGFAYGADARALEGKTLFNAVSCGARREVYSRDGGYRNELKDFFCPFEQTARLCGMEYLPPFVVHGTHSLGRPEIGRHAADYRRVVEGLRDGTLDAAAARSLPRLNQDLDRIIGS